MIRVLPAGPLNFPVLRTKHVRRKPKKKAVPPPPSPKKEVVEKVVEEPVDEPAKVHIVPEPPDHMKWLLLLLPVLLAWANSSWLYNSPSDIDPWVYFGYFLHFIEFKSTMFPDLYYGSRLPWILPGYLIHRLFDVGAAKYVLHFLFYYGATFSMYGLLKRAVGRRSALLGTIVFGTHAAFLSSIGWDYVDGAGITYNLVGLACIARASAGGRRWLWLMLGGMAGAAMVYTNLFLVVFLPFQLALYIFLTATGINRRLFNAMADLLLWFGCGAALVSVVLGVINYRLDGNVWFYATSIRAFRQYRSSTQWRIGGVAWLPHAPWLGIPAATAVACIAYMIRGVARKTVRWGDYRTVFVLQYLLAAAGMVFWYALGGSGLELSFYVSYLLPSMFLAIGCILAAAEDEWSASAAWSVAGCTAIAFAVSIRVYLGPLTDILTRTGLPTIASFVAVALLLRVLFPRGWLTVVLALTGLLTYQLGFAGFTNDRPTHAAAFQRIMEGVRTVWPYVQNRAAFWYDVSEPHGDEFNAMNATYLWGYTQISQRFPAIVNAYNLNPGATIVLLSESGQKSLERATRVFNERGLAISVMETHRIDRGGVVYDVMLFTPRDDLRNSQDVTIVRRGQTADLIPATQGASTELPLSGWKSLAMEQRPDGLLVTTPEARWGYGSWYLPLFAQRPGKYQFTLKYRIIQGRILFGGMDADMVRALGRAMLPAPAARSQLASYVQPLKAGEAIVLLIANDPLFATGAAKYMIESVRVAAAFDDDTQSKKKAGAVR